MGYVSNPISTGCSRRIIGIGQPTGEALRSTIGVLFDGEGGNLMSTEAGKADGGEDVWMEGKGLRGSTGKGTVSCEDRTKRFISARGELIVYINEEPFVLQDNHSQDYQEINSSVITGFINISTSRLEALEERLVSEIITEAAANNGSYVA